MTDRTYAERHQQAEDGKQAASRAAYVEGLRGLADLLEQNQDISLPNDTRADARPTEAAQGLHLVSGNPDRLAELLGHPAAVKIDGNWLHLVWHIAGVAVKVLAPASVGRDVVTGIRVVGDREVPVTEYLVPERFQPATTASAVKA